MADTRKLNAFRARMAAVWDIRPARVDEYLRGVLTSSARVNVLHPAGAGAIRDELAAVVPDLEPIPWADHCYLVQESYGAAVPLAHEGKVYLQNAASLIPVVALDPRPGERILDVSAAPGGKAFHLAARAGGSARLWLNDAIKPRLEKMAELATTYHVPVETMTMHQAQYLDKELVGETFDRILLDVQCSGEGRIDLRRGDALRNWSPERVEKYGFLQAKMIDAAYKLLRPGGVMVYSTCTISPEENEGPVDRVLRRHDDLDVQPLGFSEPCFRPGLVRWQQTRYDERVRHAVRVMPTREYEGFFACRLTRRV